MKNTTATTASTIASGVAYVNSVGTSQENLWLFGEQIVKLLETTEKDLKQGVKIVIAKEIAKKTDKSVKTIQNKISSAINCYNKFAKASDASYFTMRELGGKKTTTAKKFNAVDEASKYAKCTKAERLALIKALQNIL
jgi:lysyl-tRNA synthetase class I